MGDKTLVTPCFCYPKVCERLPLLNALCEQRFSGGHPEEKCMQKLKQAADQCPSVVRFSRWIVLIRFFFRFGALLYHLFNVVDKLVVDLLKLGGHS